MKLPTSKIICKNLYVNSDSKTPLKVKNPQKKISGDYILILIQKIQARNSPSTLQDLQFISMHL
jgi:hypothetical protein